MACKVGCFVAERVSGVRYDIFFSAWCEPTEVEVQFPSCALKSPMSMSCRCGFGLFWMMLLMNLKNSCISCELENVWFGTCTLRKSMCKCGVSK